MNAARAIAGAGALIGAAGLVLQYAIIQQGMASEGVGALGAAWRFLAYFTILTNTFVTLVLARAAWTGGAGGLNAPRIELMALTSILFVCAVYNVLLAPRWSPQGLQLVADVIVHQIVPAVFAFYWLARAHGRLRWPDAAFAALWPLGYAVYGLLRGRLDGFYPYFFMDPTSASWGQIAVNLAGLVIVFLIGALVMIALDRALAARAAGPA